MAGPRQPIGELDHVAVVVADLQRALAMCERVLGLELDSETTLEDAGMRVAFLRAGPARIELIEPLSEELRRLRLGGAEARIEHIAFAVDDLDEAQRSAAAGGFELAGGVSPQAPATPFVAAGARSLFSRAASSGGITFQLMEKLEEGQG